MLLFLNIIVLALFSGQVYMGCEQLDRAITNKFKVRCYARIVISGVVSGAALLILYKAYGVTDENLIYYLAYGRI
jgi:ABC-type spermidine/putrescine transport system permease subunit II